MILRRLTKHVNDQNWFAVALDFFIVVAGILIAFQITNWSEIRKDEAAFDQAMDRLYVELQTNYDETLKLSHIYAPLLSQVQTVVADLQACDDSFEAKARINESLHVIKNVTAYDIQFEAIEALVETDRFLALQSPELRDLLAYIHRDSKKFQRYVRVVENLTNEAVEAAHPAIAYEAMPLLELVNLPEEVNFASYYRTRKLNVPVDVACRDSDFMHMFIQWEGGTTYQMLYANQYRKKLAEVLQDFGHPVKETTP